MEESLAKHQIMPVSTHSRLKAAGNGVFLLNQEVTLVSTHSRLKAAG